MMPTCDEEGPLVPEDEARNPIRPRPEPAGQERRGTLAHCGSLTSSQSKRAVENEPTPGSTKEAQAGPIRGWTQSIANWMASATEWRAGGNDTGQHPQKGEGCCRRPDPPWERQDAANSSQGPTIRQASCSRRLSSRRTAPESGAAGDESATRSAAHL